MTRILVQRGSSSSSTSSNRSSQQPAPQASSSTREEDEVCQDPGGGEHPSQGCGSNEGTSSIHEDGHLESGKNVVFEPRTDIEKERLHLGDIGSPKNLVKDLEGLTEDAARSFQVVTGRSYPPPPPPVLPPPVPSLRPVISSLRRTLSGGTTAVRLGSSRRPSGWPTLSTRISQSDSQPPSPNSIAEAEGYNSADEQNSRYGSSYCDVEREQLFEREIKRVKGLEVKRMIADGNCLFRAVADQVYGDPEAYDMARQMCIDYMERERDHFSQFITEGFLSYCKRKRRDKVYGNNVEIQAFSEMYNRPIHIYSYSTEPINIFHGVYVTDTPLRLTYHQGNHYNSLIDPCQLTIGAGLGLSSLRGANIDKDQVKAAIETQQNQQIDNALLAEGRFYSDLEYTEKEIERMVLEASRAEYLTDQKLKQLEPSESSTSAAKPSSSGTGFGRGKKTDSVGGNCRNSHEASLSKSMTILLSMGFNYLQVVEAYNIVGDDIDSMICYLLDTGSSAISRGNSRQKGKAAE